MEIVKDVNVYDKISKGEYICRSDKLYTREEMREMLDSSGLKFEEIEMLYNLNAEAARKDAMEMLDKTLEGQIEEEKVNFSINSHAYDLVKSLSAGRWFALYLAGFQGLFALIFFLVYLFDKTYISDGRAIFIILIMLILSYLLAFICAYILRIERVQDDVGLLGWICNDKVELAIMKRTRRLFSVSNTLNMYDCMSDVINARTKAYLDKISLREDSAATDDLK